MQAMCTDDATPFSLEDFRVPRRVPLGLEVPLRSQAEAGIGPRERFGRCVEATRGLLAKLKH